MTTDGNGTGDDDGALFKRRVRFDADADLRLLQAVMRYQPFAADHGTKLKVWDDVADEVYTTAAKLRDVPSSRRAVMDRFHHLLQRYDQGALKLKRWTDTPGGSDKKAALVQSLFQEISSHMADSKGKRPRKGTGRVSLTAVAGEMLEMSRKRSMSSVDDDAATETSPEKCELTPVDAPASINDQLASQEEVSRDTQVAVALPDRSKKKEIIQSQSQRPAARDELLALKREKIELKRQKLEFLKQSHEDRMALERQRLELEQKRVDLEQKRLDVARASL